jgi:hypothetical protein
MSECVGNADGMILMGELKYLNLPTINPVVRGH